MSDGDVHYASSGCNILDKLPERWNRRTLRKAVRNTDIAKIKTIIGKGCDVNTEVSDVFQDTALTWSVKNGNLEVVEFLVDIPECDLDFKDRNHHTALDEALKRWLNAAAAGTPTGSVRSAKDNEVLRDVEKTVTFADNSRINTSNASKDNHSKKTDLKRCYSSSAGQKGESLKLHLGTRYRILKSLLEAGASVVSSTNLDMAVFQVLSTSTGKSFLTKLSKLVAEKGHPRVRSVLCSVLVTYRMTHDCIKCLLEAGADPQYYLTKEPSRPFMPMENALLLLRVCSEEALMSRIECDTTGNLSQMNDQQIGQLLLVLRLLVVCGHSLQLYVMNFLREHRLNFYMWVVRQRSSPLALQCLVRIKIRHYLKSNVYACYDEITTIPEELKQFLLLSEWLVPKKASVKFAKV